MCVNSDLCVLQLVVCVCVCLNSDLCGCVLQLVVCVCLNSDLCGCVLQLVLELGTLSGSVLLSFPSLVLFLWGSLELLDP